MTVFESLMHLAVGFPKRSGRRPGLPSEVSFPNPREPRPAVPTDRFRTPS